MAVVKRNFLNLVHFRALLFILQMRIFLKGCLLESMKKFKYLFFLTFFLSFFVSTSWAQQSLLPWNFDGGNFEITNNAGDDFTPVVASACQNDSCYYLVVWARKTSSGFDIYGARIDKDGVAFPGDENGFLICTSSNDRMFPSVASDGKDFLVVWQDKRSRRRWDIYGTIVKSDGQVLDPFPIATGKLTYDQVSPALAFDGENYLVVWQGKRNAKLWNIYFTRVTKDGTPDTILTLLAPSPKDQATPSVAFNGGNYFIVWQDLRNGKFWDIFGARVTPSGEILDGSGISISPTFPNDQDNTIGWDKLGPVLSWDGNQFLIVWMTSREKNKWNLEGKRVGADGKPTDLIDIQIQKDGENKIFPAILWDGDHSILVWEEPEGAI